MCVNLLHRQMEMCADCIRSQINARNQAGQLPLYVYLSHSSVYQRLTTIHRRHRAASTGSTGFVSLLLHPPEGASKPRLNTADQSGELYHSSVAALSD